MTKPDTLDLDDVWLDVMEDWSSLTRIQKRRLYRIFIVLAAGASYAVDTLLLSLFGLAGTVDYTVAIAFGAWGMTHVLVMVTLQWFGFTERFANPHLPVTNALLGAGAMLMGMILAPPITSFFLSLIFIVFGFGTLRIKFRAALYAFLVVWLAVAGAVHLMDVAHLGIASPNELEKILVWVAFGSVLLRSIGLGYYGTQLRMRVYRTSTRWQQEASQAEKLANRDALTGVLNRRAVVPEFEQQLSLLQRKEIPCCVAMLDIDHFKVLNDSHGHPFGDEVLVGFVRQILEDVRKSDKLFRYGGEEFVLLLPATGLPEAVELVERIRRDVGARTWSEQVSIRVTFSAGVSDLRATDTLSSLFSRVDRLLYAAKESGRNRVVASAQRGNPVV